MENGQTSPSIVTPKPERPTFLLVLCVLTFLGSGGSALNAIYTYFNAKVAAEVAQVAVQDAKDKIANDGEPNAGTKFADKMLVGASKAVTTENFKKKALFSAIASVFTLFGGILMFQLKKTGFWVYLLGTIISIAGPIIAFGAGNIISMTTTVVSCFIGVIFVVLYGLNLKHLR